MRENENYISKIITLLSNIQSYFILCYMYFLVFNTNESQLTNIGRVIFTLMLKVLGPIFIITPLILYIIVNGKDFKRNYLYVL